MSKDQLFDQILPLSPTIQDVFHVSLPGGTRKEKYCEMVSCLISVWQFFEQRVNVENFVPPIRLRTG